MSGLSAPPVRTSSLKPALLSQRNSMALVCLAAAWAGFVLLAGCGIFNPDGEEAPPTDGPGEYPILSQPSAVLEALEMAYSKRDSVKIKEIYDSTYTGQSLDIYDQSQTPQFTYFDEVSHVARLAATPGLTTNMELGDDPSWFRRNSDDPSHPEWAVIQLVGPTYKIEIYDGPNDSYGATGEPGTFQEFAFSPHPDETSPSDTLWKIVRWRETGNSEPPPPPNP